MYHYHSSKNQWVAAFVSSHISNRPLRGEALRNVLPEPRCAKPQDQASGENFRGGSKNPGLAANNHRLGMGA